MTQGAKGKIKHRFTRLTSPFTSGSASPPLENQSEASALEVPLIHIRNTSDISLDAMTQPSTNSNDRDSLINSVQAYYPTSNPNNPTISISRPSTRSSISSTSISEMNYSPMKPSPHTGSSGSGSTANGGPSARYLAAQGQDHAFLLSHRKAQSTQLPIIQTSSHNSSYTTSSSLSINNNNNPVNHYNMLNSVNIPTGISQTTLPSILPIHPNASYNSLAKSNSLSSSGPVLIPTLLTTKSSKSVQGTSTVSSSVGSKSRNNGGLLGKKINNDAKTRKKITHNHSHHLPLRCPFIQQDFIELEKSFESGIEQRIEQIESENNLMIEYINSLSERLNKLSKALEDQLNELDVYIEKLDSNASILEEKHSVCMQEDMDDLIKRIEVANDEITLKKEKIKDIHLQLDLLQAMKEKNKMNNVKRRKWVIFAGGVITIILILKISFFW